MLAVSVNRTYIVPVLDMNAVKYDTYDFYANISHFISRNKQNINTNGINGKCVENLNY